MLIFEDYVAEQGHALLKLAYVLTEDPHRAEDLTQSVLTAAFVKWSAVSRARSPHAYVRKMMVNTHLDWHRRRSSTERPTAPEAINVAMGARSAPDSAIAVASQDQLRQLVADLAPRSRTVLILRYFADLDDLAIAEAMGIKVASVRSLAARALESLRSTRTEKELA